MSRNRRETSITLTCKWCGQLFHPWTYQHAATYCSRRCRSLAGIAASNHTTAAPADLPVRALHTPHNTANEGVSPIANSTMPPTSTPDRAAEFGEAWRQSGEHWQRVVDWLARRRQVPRIRRQERQDDNPYQSIAMEGRTLTLNGYGASLFVKNGALVVQQGRSFSTQEATTETLYRGVHGVTQIVWLTNGGAGSLSVQALKWCASQNITVLMLTEHGACLAVIHPSPDAPPTLGTPGQGNGRPDVALRRAQYSLAPSGKDVPVARALMSRKITAQRATAEKHNELPDQQRALDATDTALAWLDTEPVPPFLCSLDGIRILEARAARGYFMAWLGLPLRLDASAHRRWPEHWRAVGPRNSALMRFHSPRNATNPAQAMLNFAYGCLESQVRQSLNAIGADIVCGILHEDSTARLRDSLVFDAMEPLRAEVDDLFLTFLQRHTFGAGDFQTRSDGSIAIHPSLCRVLVELCRLPQRRVDDEARALRTLLLGEARAFQATERK